ncbi:MAG TPA: glycosyltransferase family protein [Anaeromyxobacteraceae bacterium]|nr:glycosyltransferase family protein [Anaeromyxobacteraceae bacterium]
MRIAYGVFGYGRGHATRAMGVLPELTKRHQVLLLAGGDAHETLAPVHPVISIPTLRYAYAGSKMSAPETLRQNYSVVKDLLLRGEDMRHVVDLLAAFKPHVAICDADPFTHRAAACLGVPRISFDHFGILAHCRPYVPMRYRVAALRDVLAYRLLVGWPERAIVSSFYSAPTSRSGAICVGPLLRDDLFAAKPTKGDHLLVYLNQGRYQYTPQMEGALRAHGGPVLVYGTGEEKADGAITYRRAGSSRFIEDMASCRAVICTAGNQIVGEAVYLGKPLLVLPEESTEQRVNACAVERLGIGEQVSFQDLSAGVVRRFLARGERYIERARWITRDGRRESIDALERFAAELTGGRPVEPFRRAA